MASLNRMHTRTGSQCIPFMNRTRVNDVGVVSLPARDDSGGALTEQRLSPMSYIGRGSNRGAREYWPV